MAEYPNEIKRQTTLTEKDREFMRSYFRLADMVADLIGPHSEVVIHSIENLDASVVKIVNGHQTGRTEGSPITDMGLKMLRQFIQTGEVNSKSYFTKNKKGELLKSSTCVIAGADEKPIGLFCVNINLSIPFPDLIQTLMPVNMNQSPIMENFSSSAQELILESIKKSISDVDSDVNISKKLRNKVIVYQLYENGIFELKESATIVAQQLKITRNAVYKYLREFKINLSESDE